MVFYEAPHKLLRTLRDMLEVWGDRRVSISREMTKIHEETLRGCLSEMLAHFEVNSPKGEFTLVIEGAGEPVAVTLESALAVARGFMEDGMSLRDAARAAVRDMPVQSAFAVGQGLPGVRAAVREMPVQSACRAGWGYPATLGWAALPRAALPA